MTSTCTEWTRQKRQELIKEFGGKCCICGTTEKLEFAHKQPTEIKGEGRGKYQRIKDILTHKESYALTCKEHNKDVEGVTGAI